MPAYTVQLSWWTLAIVDQVVQADSPEAACAAALENPNYDAQRTIYDACTPTMIAAIAEGEHGCAVDAPAEAAREIPARYRDRILFDEQHA